MLPVLLVLVVLVVLLVPLVLLVLLNQRQHTAAGSTSMRCPSGQAGWALELP